MQVPCDTSFYHNSDSGRVKRSPGPREFVPVPELDGQSYADFCLLELGHMWLYLAVVFVSVLFFLALSFVSFVSVS